MNELKILAPIFIVGCPRSGTTMLRYSFNQHSNIYIYGESNFYQNVYSKRYIYRDLKDPEDIKNLLNLFFKSGDPTVSKYTDKLEYFTKRIHLDGKEHSDILRIILKDIADKKGKNRWGEKTPKHFLYLDQIYKSFPGARVIYLMRRPNDIVSSYLNRINLPQKFYHILALYILSKKYYRLFQDKVYKVNYEDIIKNPVKELSCICDFIGEQFERDMLYPGVDNSAKNYEFYKKTGRYTIQKDDYGIRKNLRTWNGYLDSALEEYVNRKNQGEIMWFDKKELLFQYNKYIIKARASKNKLGII